jgi:hypothetical protein
MYAAQARQIEARDGFGRYDTLPFPYLEPSFACRGLNLVPADPSLKYLISFGFGREIAPVGEVQRPTTMPVVRGNMIARPLSSFRRLSHPQRPNSALMSPGLKGSWVSLEREPKLGGSSGMALPGAEVLQLVSGPPSSQRKRVFSWNLSGAMTARRIFSPGKLRW